ncbi:MAG: AAA ATPase [Candidatus Magasanikbacteria bacterium GW2011_GWA2_46_17]|uniref:AAA ATPase n=1 Tax=Candidatus Magasanikbacteria bacterium GW2011_GWA2_46_17 TaxID=1619042 RepID=A0A0G1R6G8_9BACT|nr:MAG: AAA ATPase [Candidatus Magasanikbacteria bacterium GW2011_GWA2_46_17]
MIARLLVKTIVGSIKPNFVVIIYGARRVGKTVLLKQLQDELKIENALNINGDTEEGRNAFSTTSEVRLAGLVENYDLVLVDEAQRIPNVSLALKIIIDKFPHKKVIVTGSSSLELSKGMRENLTGRNMPYILFPLSTAELAAETETYKLPYLLEDQLIYGGYPYLKQLGSLSDKQKYLNSITDDYLLRDVLQLERVENAETLKKLATLLAFQIGQLVSRHELSRTLGIDVKTVSRYISLLEKSFVIFGVGSYSTNLRKEIAKSKKYYFYDLGVRNALIGQFLPLNSRIDAGALWENLLFAERMKRQEYAGKMVKYFFWRNYQGAEVDMVESEGQKMEAYEFKWSAEYYRAPKSFMDKYGLNVRIINKDNYLDFVM